MKDYFRESIPRSKWTWAQPPGSQQNLPYYNTCMPSEYYDDPVAAYDRLAPAYLALSKRREPYLRSIGREIVARIPSGSRSLLDIGAGDGLRAARIAESARIARVVLVEPSPAMAGLAKTAAEIWRIRAEELNSRPVTERFDAIICLWNVLGHVHGENRSQVLDAAAKLLSPGGRLFLDVNHRYNARTYGWALTSARWLGDALNPDAHSGDATAGWDIGEGRSISTYGHVFTHREIAGLARVAGLNIEERVVIDYADGSLRHMPWLGNLLYILRRNSPMDSSSAPATH